MKKAIITGGSKGIGKALVRRFAAEGFDVATCARSEADLKKLQAEIKIDFPEIELLVFSADLSIKEEVTSFSKYILQQWTQVDVLINNTGVFLPGAISDEEDGLLEKQINTNLYSAYYLTRALLPTMLEKKQGHIFNMCSVASIKAYSYGGSYSISKFALLGFSKCLREELKDKGLKVTSILPGATWSDSWAGADFPEDRLMPASDIAEVIWSAYNMSKIGVVEELLIRPQLGDV
jgi:short-subunit dehydrogenase